jgi:hypothetical protein
MKNTRGLIAIACVLIALSAALYAIHYLIFHNSEHIFIYMLGDLAFLPLEVLLVGIVVDRIMTRREAHEKIRKLNMVVGTFFSEIGRQLASILLNATDQREKIIEALDITTTWKKTEFIRAQALTAKDESIEFNKIDLNSLKSFLSSKRAFLVVLMENPNLLEHEKFTDLLLSAFHLTEELETRPSLEGLPPQDIAHLQVDAARVFRYLAIEWLDYMQHVKTNYPFLYSHYLRIHPFQLHPSAYVT